MTLRVLWFPISFSALVACGDKAADTAADTGPGTEEADADADTDTDTDTDADSDSYAFTSAASGEPSVSYSGQVLRQVLIDDMKSHLGGMTARLDNGAFYPEAGDVTAELEFYFAFDSSTSGQVPLYLSTDPAALQSVYDDLSTDKDLVGKLAGNDPVGQHVDWSTGFLGWGEAGSTNPEALVRGWFAEIDAQAVAWSGGDYPLGPGGVPVPAVYVTPDGRDLQQLLEKFLRGAVCLSQGADDYLDDDTEGKGLLSDHTALEEGKPYTTLEHQWDEGFGYFGAARSYGDWTDDQIADTPGRDVDGDGAVDLLREYSFGHSGNAAKRDRGANTSMDLTADAYGAFLAGRGLLAETAGTALTADQLAELKGHRDRAVSAWEAAIAATVVHYINEVLVDMSTFGGDAYDFGVHAKHWSELKGFALSLQFNPRSPLNDSDFAQLHAYLGDAPVLATAGAGAIDGYKADLLAARALIGEAYGFDAPDLGDDHGEGGW